MEKALELAKAQHIRLQQHLSESTTHTPENFYSMEDEAEVAQQINHILINK